jgi:hypothetical protein
MKIGLFRLLFAGAILLFGIGCTTYIPPSGRADLQGISTSASIKESFAAKPTAQFPASIAAIRIQAPNYRSYSTDREGGVYNAPKYSVITAKEVEEAAELERLSKLPDVAGFISISPLLLSGKLGSDRELREAAARLKAEMLLLYTFDTAFHTADASTTLTVISVGLLPTRKISVHVTASALLVDTRTGFIYAALEANEKKTLISNGWESRESADRARRAAETSAFKKLVEEFEKNWPRIVERAEKGA